MAYIRGGAEPEAGCFLCAPRDSAPEDDRRLLVVARGRRVFAILNRYPYNTGHVMVAPLRHVGELEDLEPDEASELWEWTTHAVQAHRRTSRPDGFNIGINLGTAAGAGVPGHLHVHVVPRWAGDTNFMPVLGDAKVLPEMLDETYAGLRAAFDARP